MKPRNRKKLIVSLIADDLISHKLLDALKDLNIEADRYSLNLSRTIMQLMGCENDGDEEVFEHYMDLVQQARRVDNSKGNAGFTALAREIYSQLQTRIPV